MVYFIITDMITNKSFSGGICCALWVCLVGTQNQPYKKIGHSQTTYASFNDYNFFWQARTNLPTQLHILVNVAKPRPNFS